MNHCKNVSRLGRDSLKTIEEIDIIIHECDQKIHRMGKKFLYVIEEKINCLKQERRVMFYRYDIFAALLDINIEKCALLTETTRKLKESEISTEIDDLSDINFAHRQMSTRPKTFNRKGKFLLSLGNENRDLKVTKMSASFFNVEQNLKGAGYCHPSQFIARNMPKTDFFILPNRGEDGRASMVKTIFAMEKYLVTIEKEQEEASTKLQILRKEMDSIDKSCNETCEEYSRLVQAIGEHSEVSWICDAKCVKISSKIFITVDTFLKSSLDSYLAAGHAKATSANKLGRVEKKVQTGLHVRGALQTKSATCDSCTSVAGQLACELRNATFEHAIAGVEVFRRLGELMPVLKLDVKKCTEKIDKLTIERDRLLEEEIVESEESLLIRNNINCAVHQLRVVQYYIYLASTLARLKYERIGTKFNQKLLEERVKLATAVDSLVEFRQDPIELALASEGSMT